MARRSLGEMRGTVASLVANSSQITVTDIRGILADVHRHFATQYQWSYRRRETVIQTVPVYSTGTVAVTAGSATVLGTGTAWTSAMVGRQIRITGENVIWWINAVAGQTLTLADANLTTQSWVAPSASGQGYAIFQDQYAVPADVAIILHSVRDWPLTESTVLEVDSQDPYRTGLGTPDQWYWARANQTGTPKAEQRFIGLWPVPALAMTFRMNYLVEPPQLLTDTDLPVAPSEVIEWAAGARAAFFLFAKTGDPRWNTLAMSYAQVLMGTPRLAGVLGEALQDDAHRFGLPGTLQGSGSMIGNDRIAQRDWGAMY